MRKYMYGGKLFNNMAEVEDYVELNFNRCWDCEPVSVEVAEYGLIRGRHNLPVDKFIYTNIDDVTDFSKLEEVAIKSITRDADILVIYVTGLTSATVAVINVAKIIGYKFIILKHYDNASSNYLSQWVY